MTSISGSTAATYSYDAWGNCYTCITDLLAFYNPLRYRGYIYDSETQLYYLQSRYYDPELGRFLNADDSEVLLEDYEAMLQHNLFAYCLNNPVNMYDPDGYWTLALAGGSVIALDVSLSSIGTAILGALSAVTPAGWVIIGTSVVLGIVTISVANSRTPKNNIAEERSKSPIGRRGSFNTKKKAKEAAKKAGNGKEPIHHPKGHHGNSRPHFHPNVKDKYRTTPHGASIHDHYYYPG